MNEGGGGGGGGKASTGPRRGLRREVVVGGIALRASDAEPREKERGWVSVRWRYVGERSGAHDSTLIHLLSLWSYVRT